MKPIFNLAIALAFLVPDAALAGVELTVTTFDDTYDGVCDSHCSLRDAVYVGNQEPPTDDDGDDIVAQTVTAILLPAGTYLLDLNGSGPDDAPARGDMDLIRSYEIRGLGDGPEDTIVDASGLDETPFESSADNTFTNFTIRGGHAEWKDEFADASCDPPGSWCQSCDASTAGYFDRQGNPADNQFRVDCTVDGETYQYAYYFDPSAYPNETPNGCALFQFEAQPHRGNKFRCINEFQFGHSGAIKKVGDPQWLIRRMIFEDNEADEHGGALYFGEDESYEIQQTIFRGNLAGAGGAIYSRDEVDLLIRECQFLDNESSGRGGAIYNQNDAGVAILDSLFRGNHSDDDGGAIFTQNESAMYIHTSLIEENSAGLDAVTEGEGGGIFQQNDSQLVIVESTIRNNTAYYQYDFDSSDPDADPSRAGQYGGGGINVDNDASLLIDRSLIAGNRSPLSSGGGILIASRDTQVQIRNSTISGNSAGVYGGGLAVRRGRTEGLLLIESSTVADNTATENGGGIFLNGDYLGPRIHVENSIFAGNSVNGTTPGPDNCALGGDMALPDLVSLGFNLDSDGTCGLSEASDLSSVDPLLGSLADNGGPTKTHALLEGSPAIDAGSTSPFAVDVDQRNVARPQGSRRDIGAFERQESETPGVTDTPLDLTRAIAWIDRAQGGLRGRVLARGDLPDFDIASGFTVAVNDATSMDASTSLLARNCASYPSGRIRCKATNPAVRGQRITAIFEPADSNGDRAFKVVMKRYLVPAGASGPLTLTITSEAGDTYSGSNANCGGNPRKIVCRD